ncbi:phosphate acyltransferase, partial [Salmonella enterica subsp. enterica serovar Kentucky]|nr:phosphate acyltransferase [Salmonella enterica subsp. enterica serovar Kentucky]
TFYATVNDCIDDGNSASVCADGWNNAKTEFYANVPKQLTQERATVFIFPDLNTGNTTYKAVQRSADLISIGPMLQGMRKPVND